MLLGSQQALIRQYNTGRMGASGANAGERRKVTTDSMLFLQIELHEICMNSMNVQHINRQIPQENMLHVCKCTI